MLKHTERRSVKIVLRLPANDRLFTDMEFDMDVSSFDDRTRQYVIDVMTEMDRAAREWQAKQPK
jgi:hypothetical protein